MIAVKTKAAKEKEARIKGSEYDDDDMKWRAEQDARTLIEAEKIKGDKSRYGPALASVKEQSAALARITK